jgi:hypothetical protein
VCPASPECSSPWVPAPCLNTGLLWEKQEDRWYWSLALKLGLRRIRTDFAGYPAGRISGQSKSRIPDIRSRPDIKSTFKCLEKYETHKDIRCIANFLFPYLKQSFYFIKAVTVLRKNLLKFYKLIPSNHQSSIGFWWKIIF